MTYCLPHLNNAVSDSCYQVHNTGSFITPHQVVITLVSPESHKCGDKFILKLKIHQFNLHVFAGSLLGIQWVPVLVGNHCPPLGWDCLGGSTSHTHIGNQSYSTQVIHGSDCQSAIKDFYKKLNIINSLPLSGGHQTHSD